MAPQLPPEVLRTNMFSAQFGIDGDPIEGTRKVEVRPGPTWNGPGKVYFELILAKKSMDILHIEGKQLLVVTMFKVALQPGATMTMFGTEPSKSDTVIRALDYDRSDVMLIGAEMPYDRLSIIFEPTALDLMNSALSQD